MIMVQGHGRPVVSPLRPFHDASSAAKAERVPSAAAARPSVGASVFDWCGFFSFFLEPPTVCHLPSIAAAVVSLNLSCQMAAKVHKICLQTEDAVEVTVHVAEARVIIQSCTGRATLIERHTHNVSDGVISRMTSFSSL
jgi:hypothetical protein